MKRSLNAGEIAARPKVITTRITLITKPRELRKTNKTPKSYSKPKKKNGLSFRNNSAVHSRQSKTQEKAPEHRCIISQSNPFSWKYSRFPRIFFPFGGVDNFFQSWFCFSCETLCGRVLLFKSSTWSCRLDCLHKILASGKPHLPVFPSCRSRRKPGHQNFWA